MTATVSTLSWWVGIDRDHWTDALKEFAKRLAVTSEYAIYAKPKTRKERGLSE